jgi:small subunit ribosomal protein S17
MNKRRRLTGVVTSNKMQKTVVVVVSRTYQHPLYHKVVHTHHKVKAHDELACEVGDTVQVVESRPVSAQTRFVVESIVRRAVEPEVMADEPVAASYQTDVLDTLEEEDITDAVEEADDADEAEEGQGA